MELLRNRPAFRRLWASQLISLMGDWLSFVAISLLALSEGDGVVALALVLVAHSFPHALMAPIAGALVDRFNRIALLVGSNAAQALLTVGMAIGALYGHLVAVQILLFLRASAAAFIMPAESASLPHFVSRDELYRANALISATWSVAFALGMALGGVLAMLGPVPALLIDAATFVVAALIVRPLPPVVADREDDASAWQSIRSVGHDMRSAASAAWNDRSLFAAVVAKSPLALAGGGAWVLLNLVAADPAFIGAGGLALGLLHATRGIGTGVGPIWASARIDRGASATRAIVGAQWLVFGSIALFAAVQWWPLALVAVFVWGCGTGTTGCFPPPRSSKRPMMDCSGV
jgi:MFS family permease